MLTIFNVQFNEAKSFKYRLSKVIKLCTIVLYDIFFQPLTEKKYVLSIQKKTNNITKKKNKQKIKYENMVIQLS